MTQRPEHCEHECVCGVYLYETVYGKFLFKQACDPTMIYIETCPCKHDTRTRPHTPAPEHMPMRSCFGEFTECPCDDECVVSEYCEAHSQKPSCGLTDSQCYEVQEHEKAEAARDATLAPMQLAQDMYGLMMCIEKQNTEEFMDYFVTKMEEFKLRHESLRQQEQHP